MYLSFKIMRRLITCHPPEVYDKAILTQQIYYMKTLQQSYYSAYHSREKKASIINRFFNWCHLQEEFRFGWLAVIVIGHGCIITPATLLTIMFAGNSFVLWSFAIAAMTLPLVTNLAALPTKVTIPIFFLSIVVDAAIIIQCLASL
jgi:hypothetical protein